MHTHMHTLTLTQPHRDTWVEGEIDPERMISKTTNITIFSFLMKGQVLVKGYLLNYSSNGTLKNQDSQWVIKVLSRFYLKKEIILLS